MYKKKIKKNNEFIKNKITNHLMQDGKKTTSERILLKSTKKLQKTLIKNHKEIIQLALINVQPIFTLYTSKNKKTKKVKEIPKFLAQKKTRVSMSIKYILSAIKNKKNEKTYRKLAKEFLDSAKNKSNAIQLKNTIQQKIISMKRYLKRHRWF